MATNTEEKATRISAKMIGARVLVEALADEGVEVIFGYPGAATIPIHDVLMEGKVRHILVRHEQGAAHAADGYARASGKVGVCLATSGPGALNLVTGIATAYSDSVPMVAITGQVATTKLGTDAFQEADTTGVTQPVVKHNYLVKDPKELTAVIREAFHIASTGRPGPVLVDIPLDISFTEMPYKRCEEIDLQTYRPTILGHPLQIKKAVALINSAERPLLVIGGGVVIAEASEELGRLMEKAEIPMVRSLMGKGAMPDDHPLNLGMIGMHGSPYANFAAKECDVLIAVGTRFSDRSTGRLSDFAPNAQVIHIDVDPAEIGKMRTPDVPIVGDAKNVLFALAEKVKPAEHGEWLDRLERWSEEHQVRHGEGDGRIMPQDVFAAINEITGGEAIISTDVGQHQMWANQFVLTKHPRQFLSSGGLGTMGYGIPAAIGAQVACPDATVFAIAGDGSILMNNQEIMTAVEQRLPIKIALLNNGYLGMVRQWQQLFYDRRYASTDISAQPDFVMLAKAYGAEGIRVETIDEIRPALEAAMRVTDRPCLIDFHIAREACVLPMIPAGGTVDDMLLELD